MNGICSLEVSIIRDSLDSPTYARILEQQPLSRVIAFHKRSCLLSTRHNIIASLALLAIASNVPAMAAEKGVTASVIIQAPQNTVWESIRDTKHFDNKIESHVPNEATVEQRFRIIPLLGETTAVLKVKTVPKTRIEFKLIHSDHLKALSGSWLLTPISATQTQLQLYSYVDPGLPIPRALINHFVAGKVKSRLAKVKALAEAASAAPTAAIKPSL
jgi:hypothetical protein